MKRFFCSQCNHEVFFDKLSCPSCQADLGFAPNGGLLLAAPTNNSACGFIEHEKQNYYTCSRRYTAVNCNWLLPLNDANQQCQSCRLTRMIPSLDYPINLVRWARLEAAKRRVLWQCYRLQLPVISRAEDAETGLVFDFLQDKRTNPEIGDEFIASGHYRGSIILNSSEADDSFSAAIREQMNESYRTLLGHFRHEIGHYYWMLGIENSPQLPEFRALFGDERVDYQQALSDYYARQLDADWQTHYISRYASAHPLEDWAETWTHYLHLTDTLETAAEFSLLTAPADFTQRLHLWIAFVVSFNALNASMGLDNPYPFKINAVIENKLRFVDKWVQSRRTVYPAAAS